MGLTIAQRNALRKGNPYVRSAIFAHVDHTLSGISMDDSMFSTSFPTSVLEDDLPHAALMFGLAHEDTEPGSKARIDIRKEYAAIVAVAATMGERLPPIDVTYTNMTDDQQTGVLHSEMFQDEYDGTMMAADYRGSLALADAMMATKTSSDPDTLSERQTKVAPDAAKFVESGWEEIANLKRNESYIPVTQKDERYIRYINDGYPVIDVMMLGKRKRNADGSIEKYKGRAVLRGDQLNKTGTIDPNNCFAPSPTTIEHNCCEAVAALRGMNCEPGDAVAAYLQGKQLPGELVIARAPKAFREYDENDDEIYWLMVVPLYGQPNAGNIWNRTFTTHCIDEEGISPIEQAPSLFAKCCGPNCSDRIHMPVHTDDLKIFSDDTPAAKAEHERLRKSMSTRFKMEWKFGVNPAESMFLSKNVKRVSKTCTQIGLQTYIKKHVPLTLPKPVDSYPSSWRTLAADKELQKAFDKAERQRVEPNEETKKKLRSFVGIWIYITSYFPEICYPIHLGARAVPFVTEEFFDLLLRVSVYLWYHAEEPVTYSRGTPGSSRLSGKCDANMGIKRSVTGKAIKYGGAIIMARTVLQHSIAMSTCEAELMALADLALDLEFCRIVLEHLGVVFETDDQPEAATDDPEAHTMIGRVLDAQASGAHGIVEAETDAKSAYDLCHRDSSGGGASRHIDRREFKMRELRKRKRVVVRLVKSEDMEADILTKILERPLADKHRRSLKNLGAA